MRLPATRTLRERKALEQQREDRILHALLDRDKVLEQGKREKRQKRKTVGELLWMLDVAGIQGRALRPADTYLPRSCNLGRQLVGLVDHMFVRYQVPGFLYQVCMKGTDDPFTCMHELYRDWFLALAQGGSFPKLVKGFMTGREAFAFLSAPAGRRVHENVWWAKMRVAGIPGRVADRLIERIFARCFFDDPHGRLAEMIAFYARYHEQMDRVTFGEVTDFLAWKLEHDPGFSLRGRTVASVVKLTNEWHRLMQKAQAGSSVEWPGLGLPDWEYDARDRIWVVTELRGNRELINEGRKLKHCVYSYVQACVSGRSAIFSMRSHRKLVARYTADGKPVWDRSVEFSRVTIEVSPGQRAVVQVRGPLNCAPTDEQWDVLRRWAGETGLLIQVG